MAGRPVKYDPAFDLTVERMTGHALSGGVSIGGAQPRKGQFMNPRLRRTIEKMAKRLGITAKRKWTDYELWGAIYERTKGGVQRPSDLVAGDPFCLFVTGICDQGHAPWKMTIVAKKDGGVFMDEGEAKEKLAEIRENFPVCDATLPSGDACKKEVGQFSVDMTRMSVFERAERDRAKAWEVERERRAASRLA